MKLFILTFCSWLILGQKIKSATFTHVLVRLWMRKSDMHKSLEGVRALGPRQ